MFYQYITRRVFEDLLEQKFKLSTKEQATVDVLTYQENNAQRYVAGYVCHKLNNKTAANFNFDEDKPTALPF